MMNFWHDVAYDERVKIFGTQHLLFLAFIVIVIFVFVWNLDYLKKHKDTMYKIFRMISVFQVIILYTWTSIELGLDLNVSLPIHLCRFSTILGIIYLFTNNKKVFNLLFYCSFFALIAIINPINVHPIYTHIIGYSYQISHTMILLVWICGVFIDGYRPSYKGAKRVIITLWIYLMFVWPFNYLVGNGEYLFLRGDVNRPFFKETEDYIWISVIFFLIPIYIYLITYVSKLLERKNNND